MNSKLLEAANFTPYSFKENSAWLGHLPFASWLMRISEPKIFVELGTHWGHSYFSFCQSVSEAKLATKCYAVDTWQGDEHSYCYGEEVFQHAYSHNQANYAQFSRLLRMTFDDALAYFSDGSIDLLHIDGLHNYEAVKHDFDSWLPKLAPGAIILFHDINVRERGFGVWKLWEELRSRYPNNLEFLHSHGLGVMQTEGATSANKFSWLSSSIQEQQQLKTYFSALGARQQERFELGQLRIQLDSLNKIIAERDAQLARLNQTMSESGERILSLNLAVTERDEQIAGLHKNLSDRDASISNVTQTVIELQTQLSLILDRLNQVMSESDGRIQSLNLAVTERDEQIAGLHKNLSDRDASINNVMQNIIELKTQLSVILNSRSWKLTTPLRMLGMLARYSYLRIQRITGLFQRAFNILKVAPDALTRWGFIGLMKRIIRSLHHHGIHGLLSQVRQFQSLLMHADSQKQNFQDHLVRTQSLSHSAPQNHLKTRIVYVVNQHDLMTQVYRVLNYSEALVAHGYDCVIHRDDEIDGNIDFDADILILNRISWNENINSLIRRFRISGRPVLFDIDDFIIDPDKLNLLCHTARISSAERKSLYVLFQLIEKTMLSCDAVTVSTFALKVEVEKRGLPAFVLPNNNGINQIAFAKDVECHLAKKGSGSGAVRIGYFSGTKTHDEDFAQCDEALIRILEENPDAELLIVGHLDLPPRLAAMGERIHCRPLMPHQDMLRELSTIDINLAPLELGNLFTDCKSELKIFEAALFGIPTVASPTTTFSSVIENGKTGYLAATPDDWYNALTLLVKDQNHRCQVGEKAREIIASRYAISTTVEEAKAIYNAALSGHLRSCPVLSWSQIENTDRPVITIVTVLYRKAQEVRYFLEALRRQDFPGRYEIILVNDKTPDDSVTVVQDFQRWAACGPFVDTRMEIRILHNQKNIGNCGSRNAGIREARGDVIIIVDADCMFNRSFLSEHFAAHIKGDCDVAIGPINIETHDAPPLSVLGRYESNRLLAEAQNLPQDPTNLDSFVNCITRNFSIQRSFLEKSLKEALFDEAFSYSANPESGFGWEDVEMGYRVYRAGGRIKYLPDTVSIHVSHESSANEAEKPLRSMRNFRRLFEKHPDILLASRQWSIRTYEAIVGWASSVGTDFNINADYQWLDARFRRYRQAPIVITRKRKLRILTHRWHVPHQFELYKTGHDFTLLTQTGTGLCDSWEPDKRPMPGNARLMPAEKVNPNEFDLAILHFDENVLRPDLCHGKVPDDWGRTLRWFIDNVNLPKVAICHGTPQFVGQYNGDYKGDDLGQVLESERRSIVNLLGDIMVVCNSNQAQFEWGFKNSRTIWHGFSPHEYPPGSHVQGVLVMLQAAMQNRPHYNGLFVYEEVCRILGDRLKLECLNTPDPPTSYTPLSPEWAVAKYQNYAREIGRYSTYFNPTVRSPMPRARGEAMMAGLVSVSLRNHDVDLFIKNGVNGFYADTVNELAEQLIWLSQRPSSMTKMGQASRVTAMDVFNQDRYLSSWCKLLNEISV